MELGLAGSDVVLELGECQLSLPDTGPNRKAMVVLSRQLVYRDSGKRVFTFGAISEGLGHADRQWSNNYYREFQEHGEDLLAFLQRKNSLKAAAFDRIEEQILQAPLLPLKEQYRLFQKQDPQLSISYATFLEYVRQLDSCKLLRRLQQLVSAGEVHADSKVYLEELLRTMEWSASKKKEIVAVFPEVETEQACSQATPLADLETPHAEICLLVTFLYACGLSQDVLSLLLGVGKTTIHHWIYQICTLELETMILDSIRYWSGQINADEKWIKINGVWYFLLHIVDAATGFPLLMQLYPTLDATSWKVFFARFKSIYGTPKRLISDGSKSLQAGKNAIFPNVVHQLCTFHKLRNLYKVILRNVRDKSQVRRCLRLAQHIFSNRYVSSRKHAAQTLKQLGGEQVATYIDAHILGKWWRKLTRSLTNNASERFNRKVKKCVSVRYGLPTEESARVLIRALWLKELLLNGQKHIAATHPLNTIDLSRICQNHLPRDHILHFLRTCLSLDPDIAA